MPYGSASQTPHRRVREDHPLLLIATGVYRRAAEGQTARDQEELTPHLQGGTGQSQPYCNGGR